MTDYDAVSGLTKMISNLETRVGYKTLSIMRDMIIDYISAYTINGKYKGELHYLIAVNKLDYILGEK